MAPLLRSLAPALCLLALFAAASALQGDTCTLEDGRPGLCVRLADCEVDFSELAQLTRQSSICEGFPTEQGICCPVASTVSAPQP